MSTQSDHLDDQTLDDALRNIDPARTHAPLGMNDLVDLVERSARPRRVTKRWRTGITAGIGVVALAGVLTAAASTAGVLFPLSPLSPGERWSISYILFIPPASAHSGCTKYEVHPMLANLTDAQFQAIENDIDSPSWKDLTQDVQTRTESPTYAGQRGDYMSALNAAIFSRLQAVVPTLRDNPNPGVPFPDQPGPVYQGIGAACFG
jgi:hypothetical protein